MQLCVHGTTERYSLQHVPCEDTRTMEEAQELVIVQYGEKRAFEDKMINLYTYRAGYHGVSLLVENCHHMPLVFTLDCSESENVISHRGTLSHTETVPPHHRVIFHHLMPREHGAAWAWAYSAGYMFDEGYDPATVCESDEREGDGEEESAYDDDSDEDSDDEDEDNEADAADDHAEK